MDDLIEKDALIDYMKQIYCERIESSREKCSACEKGRWRGVECSACWVNDCIDDIENAPAVNRWIPVSERLPEHTGYYLVCDSTAEFDNIRGRQDVSKFVIGRHGGHWYGAIRGEYITHWMYLPEPPEEE